MLFLLNDTLFNLNRDDLSPNLIAQRFASVSMDYVQQLTQELFAESPSLQRTHPEQGAKVAALIAAKSPEINAALFVAPSAHCKPSQVGIRFAALDIIVMGRLQNAQINGHLDAETVDREVWRLLAA
jgi:hypothetical protein